MSKVLRVVAVVAAVAAVVFAPPLAGIVAPALGISAATAATIAAVAAAVSTAATVGAQLLAKPPPMRGTVNQVTRGKNMPIPYSMGYCYLGGFEVYDGSGGNKNSTRSKVSIVTAAGPIDGFEKFLVDYKSVGPLTGDVTGYYAGFLRVSNRLGLRPDTAFNDSEGTMPGWNATRKLSGFAAWKARMEFDEDGKRYAAGVPQLGAVFRGVKVYDPRQDSTYPGGSGTQRWNDELTWDYGTAGVGTVAPGRNPGLHALAYVRGRYIEKDGAGAWLGEPVKLLGCGLRDYPENIDIAKFVEFANLCDANGWTVNGTIYEQFGTSKWDNLKRICAAGGAVPIWTGGIVTLQLSAPATPLFTITKDDLADEEVRIRAMQPYAERYNSMVPRFRDESNRWEYVQLDEAITVPTYLAEDGELKTRELQWDLVTNKDQVAQLAAYQLVDGREFEVNLTVKPRLLPFRLGEVATVDLPEQGLFEQPCKLVKRQLDPMSGRIRLTLMSETVAKHEYALGLTGEAPETPTILDHGEADAAIANNREKLLQVAVSTSFPVGLTLTFAENGNITISNHTRRYTDGHADVAVTGTTLTATGLVAGDLRAIGYDDEDRVGGAVAYQLFTDDIDARASSAHPGRHYVGYGVVPTAGSGPSDGEGGSPPGGRCVTVDTPILMADKTTLPAGEIEVGDWVLTRHEATLKWGAFMVEAHELAEGEPLFEATIGGLVLRGTEDHRVFVEGTWKTLGEIGAATGETGTVVKMTVAGAHTYVSNGILSHNMKIIE